MTEQPYALEVDRVAKAYAGVSVLADIELSCRPGEVHALVGENGAGKSTLMKIAAGAVKADTGSVRIAGRHLAPSPRSARSLGLFTAYQDTALVPKLTVAENVMLSFVGLSHPRRRISGSELARLIAPFDLPCRLDDVVATLSPGVRQLLETVRTMIHRPKVLLLDEPTAALDATTIAKLERMIRLAAGQGTAILYVSHRLDEVQRIADRLTVIRDGRLQGTYPRGQWNSEDIVARMVGQRIELTFPPKPGVPSSAPAVMATENFRGHRFGPVSITVRRGEVVGIAGAEGNGQREFLRTLVGLRTGEGICRMGGRTAHIRTPRDAVRQGICFLSGDRAAESTFAELSVMENSTIGGRGAVSDIGLVIRSRERASFEQAADRLGVVRASVDQPIGELSGGNQQKTVVSRSFHGPWSALVVDEPTQGVDARSRLQIYRALRGQAEEGTAILISSSDATELSGLCDRVYVLSRGRIVDEIAGDEMTDSGIVSSFVNAGSATSAEQENRDGRSASPWSARWRRSLRSESTPIAVLALLIVAIGAYTSAKSSLFLTSGNLASLLVVGLPLFAVALGQQSVLLAGGFDISVGSTISLSVVLASFWVTQPDVGGVLPGVVLCILIGVGVGVVNWFVIRVLGVSPIIATIGTLGILAGLAIVLRPSPAGTIGTGLVDPLSKQVAFLPDPFIVLVVLAVLAELWLRTTMAGLVVRATGYSEEAARRVGVRVEAVKIAAYVVCAVMAVVAGLLLAVQVGLGQNSAGVDFALPAFTACFLGGAALAGGAGSFIGALLGALFLSTLTNVIPLLGLPDAMNGVFTGGLTILAVVIYTLTRGAPPALTRRWPFLQKLTRGTRGSLPGSPAASSAPASNAAEKVTGPGA